jgi:hypothetical protein
MDKHQNFVCELQGMVMGQGCPGTVRAVEIR